MPTDALLRERDALIGEERVAAEWAVKLVVVEPPFEAAAMERVAAGKPANLVTILEGPLTHNAVMALAGAVVGVVVEQLVVEGELIGEHDEAGESGSDGGEEVVVDDDLVGGGGGGEAEGLEEMEE